MFEVHFFNKLHSSVGPTVVYCGMGLLIIIIAVRPTILIMYIVFYYQYSRVGLQMEIVCTDSHLLLVQWIYTFYKALQ